MITDRESGSGFNRLLGPDFQWGLNGSNQFSGQFLLSDTKDEVNDSDAGAATARAMLLSYSYRSAATGIKLDYRKLGHDFRAANGFIPQVGIEQKTITILKSFYPQNWLTLVEPGMTVDSTVEIGDRTVSRSTYPYLSLNGKWNFSLLLQYHVREKLRTGTQLPEYNFLEYQLETKPSRRVSSVTLAGQLGEQADVVNARVGRGGIVTLNAIFLPTIHMSIDIQAERQWLNIGNNHLFTADVAQLKTTYNFSSRVFLRLIGQYSHVRRNPDLYTQTVQQKEGSWGGSILYGYRFNWQTAICVGCSDERLLADETGFEAETRHFFVKFSYAFEH